MNTRREFLKGTLAVIAGAAVPTALAMPKALVDIGAPALEAVDEAHLWTVIIDTDHGDYVMADMAPVNDGLNKLRFTMEAVRDTQVLGVRTFVELAHDDVHTGVHTFESIIALSAGDLLNFDYSLTVQS